MPRTMLVVDLGDRTIHREELPEQLISDFLGGRGLGIALLYKRLSEKVDPLNPDNPLIFTTGPLQGADFPFSSKLNLTTKSPQTGLCAFSIASCKMGHFLRRSGIDVLFITGQAQNWTYLWINNGRVEFKDAKHLYGSKATQAQAAMVSECHPKAEAAVIGPAGEHGVRIAAIVTGGDRLRTFGRCGVGAVMGSKKLKGLVVYGDKPVESAKPEEFKEAKKFIAAKLREHDAWVSKQRQYGSSADIIMLNQLGLLPTRNWKYGVFEDVEKIAPHTSPLLSNWKVASCSLYCPAPCSHITHVESGPFAGAECDGPEYETLYAFGSNLFISSPEFIVAANQLCDELGLDTMSTGLTIGFAMECLEKGIITGKDTHGLELAFGNYDGLLGLIEDIAYRRNFGDVLADGVRAASQHFGGNSASFAIHSKGLEFGGYEPRGSFGQALQYALSNRGGCHHDMGAPCRIEIATKTQLQIVGKGKLLLNAAERRIMYDSSILCTFSRSVLGEAAVARATSAALGIDMSESRLQTAAERIMDVERMFNLREGIRKVDDRLPDRLTKEPMPSGPTKGNVVPLEALLDDFYATAGWDKETGIPTQATLTRLGINELIRGRG
jgi:aldehyde:ferredoxin oxidoreductase